MLRMTARRSGDADRPQDRPLHLPIRAESVSITDDCAGPLPAPQDSSFIQMTWTPPHDLGRTCTTTVQATSWQGNSSSVSAQYTLP